NPVVGKWITLDLEMHANVVPITQSATGQDLSGGRGIHHLNSFCQRGTGQELLSLDVFSVAFSIQDEETTNAQAVAMDAGYAATRLHLTSVHLDNASHLLVEKTRPQARI